MQPRIAIPQPTSTDLQYNRDNWKDYAAAVEAYGGVAVEVPLALSPREIARIADSCQGILLPGSPADVNPQKFGQAREERTAPADLPRENVDELLLQDAHNLYKPLLGVCFGTQMLNVWRGGTLVQDLHVMPVNHSAGKAVAVAHSTQVLPGSLLWTLLQGCDNSDSAGPDGDRVDLEGAAGKLPTNSSHHQAVGIAGDGLTVSGRSTEDGVVEAVEGGQWIAREHRLAGGRPAHWVLGVQWHPERTLTTEAGSRAIFRAFVEQARLWTPREITTSVAAARQDA